MVFFQSSFLPERDSPTPRQNRSVVSAFVTDGNGSFLDFSVSPFASQRVWLVYVGIFFAMEGKERSKSTVLNRTVALSREERKNRGGVRKSAIIFSVHRSWRAFVHRLNSI